MLGLFKLVVTLGFTFYFGKFVVSVPQVFTESYTSCVFHFNGGKHLTFPNKLWTIDRKKFSIHFSLCKTPQRKCGNKSSSCLKFKNSNGVTDLGHEFVPGDSDEIKLLSINGAKCRSNPTKNYTLIVTLQCSDSIKPQPRLMPSEDEDECIYEALMMSPDCHPKCTEMVQGSHLLDIRNFPKNIQLQSESTRFSLSLCGSNKNCGKDTSTCEILNNTIVPLATLESQHLIYDINKNELTARGRYKEGRVIREVQILIKCQWETELHNVMFKKAHSQGRRYRFELESSYGCVKLPHSCALSSVDNLNYDLSKLYSTNGWEVAGVPNGRILINICGPLNVPSGICADQYSQVCHISTNHTNRGSILSSLKASDDFLKAVFVSGSTCYDDATKLSHSTEIEFSCSKTESGPIFKNYTRCVTSLIWKTPYACPIDYYTGSECYINDRISNRNLQKLYSESDKVLSVNTKSKLIYNICGPIHSTCDNFTNVSFCLKTDNKETVIGWNTKNLISENGLVRMELNGNRCLRNKSGKVIVNFVCTYQQPTPASQVTVAEDGCKYSLTVFTPSACFTQNVFKNCSYCTDDVTYDLSPLVSKNRNYVIRDPRENTEYIFNLCGPIISGSEALCRGDTMFCLRNKSELNVKNRFTSLGGTGQPRLRNNTLVVEANMGSLCEGFGHYKSVIAFECSPTKSPPTFLSKDGCVYNFQWRTPEACPQHRQCMISGTKSDGRLDLTNLQTTSLKFNVDNGTNVYEFNLCRDVYSVHSNGANNVYSLNRQFFKVEQESFLVLDLKKQCINNNTITKVIFKVECSETFGDSFEETSFVDCTLNITLSTNIFCLNRKEKPVQNSVIQPKTYKEYENGTEIVTLATTQFKQNCSLINGNTGYTFNLSKMQSEKLHVNNNYFTINFNEPFPECPALFCKNGILLIPTECPVVTFNYTHHLLKLEYHSKSKCEDYGEAKSKCLVHCLFHKFIDFYVLEVIFKCNQTKSGPRIMQNEICKTVISYDLSEACDLLNKDTVSSVPVAAVAGSVSGILIVIAGIILIYLNRRRCDSVEYNLLRGRNKSRVSIYERVRENCSL